MRPRDYIRTALLMAAFGCFATGQEPGTGSSVPPGEIDVEELLRRIESLESKLEEQGSESSEAGPTRVDLDDEEVPFLYGESDEHILGRPWYKNIDVWGFGAFDYLMTGDEGTHPDGSFIVKESTVFLEADVWEGDSLFFELQVNRLGKDDSLAVRTGEVNVHFRDVWRNERGDHLGVKVGRLDIPFGEEYLWQDASDNPLFSTSAAYPYGYDEGVALYGSYRGVGWIASLMDGTDERSFEDDPAKALNLKLYGEPASRVYVSGSFMINGEAEKSAFEFGGSHFQPVGAGGTSSAGVSPSEKVDASLYELDTTLELSEGMDLDLSFGQAFVDDEVGAFDRDITWYSIQSRYQFTPEVYGVFRYSEIGTFDSDEGYHFDGKIVSKGNSTFGYDAESLRRISAGLGWSWNPHSVIKLEVGQDRFEVIDGSPLDPDSSGETFFAVELVAMF
jgi:hypothetical protein